MILHCLICCAPNAIRLCATNGTQERITHNVRNRIWFFTRPKFNQNNKHFQKKNEEKLTFVSLGCTKIVFPVYTLYYDVGFVHHASCDVTDVKTGTHI